LEGVIWYQLVDENDNYYFDFVLDDFLHIWDDNY